MAQMPQGYHQPTNEGRPNMADELLTTAEVADLCRVSEATVRWWRHMDRGPQGFALAGGKRVVYRRSVVEAWIARGEADARRVQTA